MKKLFRKIQDKVEEKCLHYHHDVHRYGILLIAAIVCLQFFTMGQVAVADELTAQSLSECVNAIRQENGGAGLSLNPQLTEAAENKLKDMQEYHYWAHMNPETGKKPWDFMDEAGYYYHAAGENLAIGFEDSQEVCAAWKKSRHHFENIINPAYKEFGFAIEKADLEDKNHGILVVLLFGSTEHPVGTSPIKEEQVKMQNGKRDNIFFAIFFSFLSRLQ